MVLDYLKMSTEQFHFFYEDTLATNGLLDYFRHIFVTPVPCLGALWTREHTEVHTEAQGLEHKVQGLEHVSLQIVERGAAPADGTIHRLRFPRQCTDQFVTHIFNSEQHIATDMDLSIVHCKYDSISATQVPALAKLGALHVILVEQGAASGRR